jgi:hypothetical protein
VDDQKRSYSDEDRINKFQLDAEWEQQGDRYLYWSRQAAIAAKALADCDMRRKVLMAQLYKEHRQNFEMDNIKATDKMIDAEVHADARYKEITIEQINLQEAAQIMTDVKWNFQARQERIVEMQKLFLAGYYAAPSDGGKEVKKQLTEALQGTLPRRRRGGEGD